MSRATSGRLPSNDETPHGANLCASYTFLWQFSATLRMRVFSLAENALERHSSPQCAPCFPYFSCVSFLFRLHYVVGGSEDLFRFAENNFKRSCRSRSRSLPATSLDVGLGVRRRRVSISSSPFVQHKAFEVTKALRTQSCCLLRNIFVHCFCTL